MAVAPWFIRNCSALDKTSSRRAGTAVRAFADDSRDLLDSANHHLGQWSFACIAGWQTLTVPSKSGKQRGLAASRQAQIQSLQCNFR